MTEQRAPGSSGGLLQLPDDDAPFPVCFEREEVTRQRQQAVLQAQSIAELEASDMTSEASTPLSGSYAPPLSSADEDFLWAGEFGEGGVLDSSGDLEDFLAEEWLGSGAAVGD
jgi:hypothetical protein